MFDIPNVVRLKGTGEFCSSKSSVTVAFELLNYPVQIKIIAKIEGKMEWYDNSWKLNGFLENQRPIKCEHLLLKHKVTNFQEEKRIEYKCEFVPLNEDIVIGSQLNLSIKEAYYPLVSYFEGTFSLSDDGWNIEVINDSHSPILFKQLAENWQIPIEGLVLRLSHPDATIDQYRNKARQISILLSLAYGNEVTFHRQIISYGKDGEVEIWRRMVGGEYGHGAFILESDISNYIKEILPIWRSLTEEEQKNIRVAISYINLSHRGYMDSRLLQIAQAWEMLANAWGNQTKELKDSIKELRNELKEVLKKWRNKYPTEDPKGFLGTRITDALEWDQALKKMEQLVYSYKINTQKIGLDFNQLIDARDSVVHTCIMSVEVRNDKELPPYKLLMAAQFCLRILLLRKLGYSGLIATYKDGCSTFEKISEYYTE